MTKSQQAFPETEDSPGENRFELFAGPLLSELDRVDLLLLRRRHYEVGAAMSISMLISLYVGMKIAAMSGADTLLVGMVAILAAPSMHIAGMARDKRVLIGAVLLSVFAAELEAKGVAIASLAIVAGLAINFLRLEGGFTSMTFDSWHKRQFEIERRMLDAWASSLPDTVTSSGREQLRQLMASRRPNLLDVHYWIVDEVLRQVGAFVARRS